MNRIIEISFSQDYVQCIHRNSNRVLFTYTFTGNKVKDSSALVRLFTNMVVFILRKPNPQNPNEL